MVSINLSRVRGNTDSVAPQTDGSLTSIRPASVAVGMKSGERAASFPWVGYGVLVFVALLLGLSVLDDAAEQLYRGAALVVLLVGLIATKAVPDHAKNLYDKTGVRKQSELVRLVLRGPAGLRS